MKWTYDEVMGADRPRQMVAIYLTEKEDGGPIQTINLKGAHVALDVDMQGNVVSIEILGPAIYHSLDRLGEYLMEPASNLGEEGEVAADPE